MSEEGQIRDCEEASEAEEGEIEPYLEEGESSTKLLERLKELEAENSALALANESQREAYERCLDEVANHVVQALLNQKDLREECIKLKMRVFELERQNQTLSELLHQKLHSHLGPCQQRQAGPILEHSPKTPPAGSDMPAGSTCQMSTKSDGEHTRNGAPGARGPALSMDALSPFFQKKAHILEVLRKLEETDPLKFHPSAGLSSYCDFSQALFSADTTFNTANCPPQLKVCWPLCLHSCSDSAVRDGKGAVPGAGPEVCRPCLLLAHRSLEELLTRATAHSTGVEVLDSLAWPETKVAPVANSAGVSQSRTHMHSLSAGVCALPAENRYEERCGLLKPGGANPHLCSPIREADRNGFAHREPEPELPVLEEVQSSTRPCKKGSCNRPPCKPSPGDPNAVTAPLGKDEKPTAAVAFQSLAVGPEECFFSMAAEVAKVKNSLYAATSSLPVPACARVAYCKQEAERPAYNGLSFSSNESCTSKKVAVEPYVLSAMPEKGGPTKQLSHKCKPVLIATSPSCLNESKPSPISSPSRLLKFLKIPSIGERAQAANPLRLSPQLTRSSKIPCRSNNYEVYHSPTACRAATTAEKSRQPPLSSSPKMDLCPATQSTPPFVPKPEDASTPPTKDTGYSSHSPPKAGQNMGASPNSQSQPPRATQKVPHYENVSELAVPLATPHFLSGPEYEDPLQERRLSPPGEEGSRSVDTPTTAPPCGTKPAGRGDGEEGVALYQLHSHRSLPISAAIHKVQSSCSHFRASSSQYVAEGTDPYAAPKKPPTGKLLGEAGHQPFQERLAALGKLKSAEDLRIGGGRPGSEEDKELRNESRATVNDERNKTTERQSERNIDKEGGTKYTNSLDGKPYPKARLGDDLVKLPGPCLAYEPGSSLSADRVEQDAPPPRTCATKMAESPNIKAGLQNPNPDTPQVLLNYVKSTATHNPAHNGRAVSGPHNSPSKAQSKPGQSSAQPGTTQPFQAERSASPVITPAPHSLLCRLEDRSMHTASKKKGLAYVESLPPPPPRPAEPAVERKALPTGPQSAIEQKVMKGIEENVLKLQVQDRGQPAEAKQRTSNGIASWFGLRKSKLPALSRKPDTGRPKEDRKEWRLVPSSSSFTSSSGSSSKTATKKKVETEGLNISKLMEKAEDLRKALEEEQAYVKGVALERPSRGHSCEVVMNQAQGQLSVMYRGVASDTFMQQLLHRVDVKDGGGDMLQAHRRLSFDSKKSRPVFGQQRNGIIVTSRSRDVTETGAELASNDDVTADKGLVVSMNPQHFEGCGASTHTLDSGIGTFPLPEYTGSAAGKSIPKARPRWEQDSHGKQGPATKVPRKARTLDKELTSLEEDWSKQGSPRHGSGPESKGSNSRPPATIHEDEDTSKPSKNWTFPHLKVSAVPVEMYLGVNEEVGTGGPGSPFRGLCRTLLCHKSLKPCDLCLVPM